MKKYLTIAASVLAGATLLMATAPAMARVDVDVNLGIPGIFQAPVYMQPGQVYVQPRPVYVERERENGWRERQWRMRQWQERERERQWHERRWQEEHHDHHALYDERREHRDYDRGERHGHHD